MINLILMVTNISCTLIRYVSPTLHHFNELKINSGLKMQEIAIILESQKKVEILKLKQPKLW